MNPLSGTELSTEAYSALFTLHNTMKAGDYADRSIANYAREIRFLFAYYRDKLPTEITALDVTNYIVHIKDVHQAGYTKCKMVACSVAFFFQHVLKQPYSIPSKLYPRKQFKLPNVMSQEEIKKLFQAITNEKHLVLLKLIYSTGMRLDECRYLQPQDIDSTNNRVKVKYGKGRKERYTILSSQLIEDLRTYYRNQRPVKYLFNGQQKGKVMSAKAIQWAMAEGLKKAGIVNKKYSIHTLRHSFATHLLDGGNDIHTIKELLGHSKIETTMIYLHLTAKKQSAIVNPLDTLYGKH